MILKATGLLFALLLALTGCTSVSTVIDVQEDLRQFKRVYVQSSQNDSNHIDQRIANELVRHGFRATAGVRTMMPEDTQLIVYYDAQWNWEFRTYLIQLEVTVRDAGTGKQLAVGRILHPGVTGKSPEKMIAEVIGPLLTPKK